MGKEGSDEVNEKHGISDHPYEMNITTWIHPFIAVRDRQTSNAVNSSKEQGKLFIMA